MVTADPRIDSLLSKNHPICSVEFFPPKDDAGVSALRETAAALQAIHPAFVSVTYGAGGSTRDRTAQMSTMLREEFGFAVMPHLTCVNHTCDEILDIARAHHARGIRNIMALRGDVPKGLTAEIAFKEGLRYGADIVGLLNNSLPDMCFGVGGYPEKHPEAVSLEVDIDNLKRKVDAGAAFITTQLFFENDAYHAFVDRCRARGITIPILPGIMPALSMKSIKRMTELCGSTLPVRLARRLEIVGDNAEVVEFVGIEWAVTQIRDLLARGAPGYHLYILNRAKSALALAAGLPV
ncbi:MAG TPA: methylenetetrahydrofolate reductase [NAD(P)H] [Opitutaceae bacterium]